jgi:uncharacterized membrane protein YjfL (UPF0719 family)
MAVVDCSARLSSRRWCGGAALAAWLFGRGEPGSAAVRVSLLLDLFWASLSAGGAKAQPNAGAEPDPDAPNPGGRAPATDTAEVTKAFRETTGVVISTSGVVLGLVSALSSQITPSLKVGVVALVVAILVAIVLYLYILYPLPQGVQPNVLIRYLMNVAFFALAFGLLSIACRSCSGDRGAAELEGRTT